MRARGHTHSCVYLAAFFKIALYSQNACVCVGGGGGGACVRACVRACVHVYALRIFSRDKIVRFKNIIIIVIVMYHFKCLSVLFTLM